MLGHFPHTYVRSFSSRLQMLTAVKREKNYNQNTRADLRSRLKMINGNTFRSLLWWRPDRKTTAARLYKNHRSRTHRRPFRHHCPTDAKQFGSTKSNQVNALARSAMIYPNDFNYTAPTEGSRKNAKHTTLLVPLWPPPTLPSIAAAGIPSTPIVGRTTVGKTPSTLPIVRFSNLEQKLSRTIVGPKRRCHVVETIAGAWRNERRPTTDAAAMRFVDQRNALRLISGRRPHDGGGRERQPTSPVAQTFESEQPHQQQQQRMSLWEQYCTYSTIHGFKYLVDANVSWWQRWVHRIRIVCVPAFSRVWNISKYITFAQKSSYSEKVRCRSWPHIGSSHTHFRQFRNNSSDAGNPKTIVIDDTSVIYIKYYPFDRYKFARHIRLRYLFINLF